MKILFAASESSPFAKTGGMGDVCGALPKALKKLGCDVRLIMPYYQQIQNSTLNQVQGKIQNLGFDVSVQIGGKEITGQLYRFIPSVFSLQPSAYFIKCDKYFDREYLYSTADGDYPDNLERFVFFSKAVLEVIRKLDFRPNIIHCHDWQTGLIPAYLKTVYKDEALFANIKTLFTIHNTAYQGLFPSSMFSLTGLPDYVYNPEGIEFWGLINLLKSGIVFSDIITTVSERYCQEISETEFGFGLEGVLQAKGDKLCGILNGVDYDEWNPVKDKFIASNYNKRDLSGKIKCRKDLLKEYGLKTSSKTALIGIISRFISQKGFDIMADAMDELMTMDLAVVVVGSGERRYSDMFEAFARKYPEKLAVKIAFDNRLAHKITAGCDMLLMPSHYEPCGMTQMYAMKYGTIPIVRATGGLDDTIKEGNGFKFREYSSNALIEKVKEVLSVFNNKVLWNRLIHNAMQEDFSWDSSAKKYLELYTSLFNASSINQAK